MCRSLNIPFLWVDALCIVQNDEREQDWYEQSGDMCDIYSNAHLVISVDASPSSNFGFLPGRDHIDKKWEEVHVSHEENNHHIVGSVRTHMSNTVVTYDGRAWNGKSVSPLLQRGWALQESMLANRLLRFTVDGMRWECNRIHHDLTGLMSKTIRTAKLTRNKAHMDGTLKYVLNGPRSDGDEAFKCHIIDFMGRSTPASLFQAWYAIVSYYSERDLTNISDKLSALSGLARLVSEALFTMPTAYVAGHWKSDLSRSLLWYCSKSKLPNRSLPYRAPTWSWASVDGQISYFHEQYQFRFENQLIIYSAECNTSLLDPFGRVTFGKLSVNGFFARVLLQQGSERPEKTQYSGHNDHANHAFSDYFSWVGLHPGEHTPRKLEPTPSYEVLLDDKLTMMSNHDQFACLLVGRHWDDWTGGCKAWWLVLRQSLLNDDRWERIGVGYFHEYSKDLALFLSNKCERKTLVIN